MDIYIGSIEESFDYFKVTDMIDNHESMVWTDRFNSLGDFELDIHADSRSARALSSNSFLKIPYSKRMMIVEQKDVYRNESGDRMLKVTGRSIEALLDQRVAWPNTTGTDAQPYWVLDMTPIEAIEEIIMNIWRITFLDGWDINTGGPGPYPPDNLSGPINPVRFELPPGTVLEKIHDICNTYRLGYRIYKNDTNHRLILNIYAGNDRTGATEGTNAVVFGEDLENWSVTSDIEDFTKYKTVAYVIGPAKLKIVYPDNPEYADGGGSYRRKVLYVDGSSVPADHPDVDTAMETLGKQALRNAVADRLIDGKVALDGRYIYEEDYFVGDLVLTRDSTGNSTPMRVVEQIIIDDSEGLRMYPTLEQETEITPGVWRHGAYNVEWPTVDETWAQQPD